MLLEVRSLEVHYGAVRALQGIDIDVERGEVVALIGANGAGKTTLLRALSGVRPKSSGAVTFDGRDITRVTPHELVTMGISQAPEGRGIFPGMTVVENLRMGAYTRKGTLDGEYERVFELFPVLKERSAQLGGTLSGGEQQMLAIGRALMAQPSLLLLDEPSMGLAPRKVAQIFEIISEIRRQGVTILLVEQNAVQALRRADRAYLLETGVVKKHGPASELLDDDSIRRAYLGEDVGS